jgi:hypothetical protein
MSQRKSDLGIPLPYTWLNPSTRPKTWWAPCFYLLAISRREHMLQAPLQAALPFNRPLHHPMTRSVHGRLFVHTTAAGVG